MKAKSGIAILPTGASHSGYILRRERDGKVWGFIGVGNRAIALPVMTVLIVFPEGEMFMTIPTYAKSLIHAKAGEPSYILVNEPIVA